MSKSTLSSLKGEVNREEKNANSTCSSIKSLDNSILNAMDDKVGISARESLTGIYNSFSYDVEKGYKSANNAISALERGYTKIDSILNQADKLLAGARDIVRELGEL